MDIENCKVAMRMMHNDFWSFSFEESTARHVVVANGVPPIGAEPFAWSYKHASTFLGSRGAAARGHIKCSELYSTFCLRRKDDCQVLNKGDYFEKLKRGVSPGRYRWSDRPRRVSCGLGSTS